MALSQGRGRQRFSTNIWPGYSRKVEPIGVPFWGVSEIRRGLESID